MSIFTQDLINQARQALQRLSGSLPPDATDSVVCDVFAGAAWSGLGEPGDRLVGLMCDALGSAAALDALASGFSVEELSDLVVNSGIIDEVIEDKDTLTEALGEAKERWMPRVSHREAIAHLERAARIGATVITPENEDWPDGLSRLGQHRPAALWIRGDSNVLAALRKSVAIVGARASTGYGEHVTMDVVTGLVNRGYCVVSGAAYGIDGMAHRATLASEGATVAVLAGGIDRLYPSGHDALLRRIIEQGVVVTELPCGFAPTKWRFLQRNRLIAALTQATVVIEAGWRSGSLNTAHHALDMNIPVGAVPGPITNPSSAGCHRLLRETPAVCVTTVDEIVELTGGENQAPLGVVEMEHPNLSRVLDALSVRTARSIAELCASTGLSRADATATLGLLEMRGAVRERQGDWVRT